MFNQSALPLCHSRLTSFSLSNHCIENTCEFRHNCAFYKLTDRDEDTLTFTDNKTKLSVKEKYDKIKTSESFIRQYKDKSVGDLIKIEK